jgi:hypothetical protein
MTNRDELINSLIYWSIRILVSKSLQIVSSTEEEIVFKLRQEYRPKLMPAGKAVNSLVSLALEKVDGQEEVVYHKDMWNEKDYSYKGLGNKFKTLNGDHLTKITQPPETV